jgi:hypothetical protein
MTRFPWYYPHICRLESSAIYVEELPDVLRHFYCHVPFLERLDIEMLVLNVSSIVHISMWTSCCYVNYACGAVLQTYPGKIWEASESPASHNFIKDLL